MPHPLVCAAAGMALGIWAGYEDALPLPAGLVLAAAALLATALAWRFRLSEYAGAGCLVLACAGLGAAYAVVRSADDLGPLLSAEPRLLCVRGYIADRPSDRNEPPSFSWGRDRHVGRFTLQVTHLRSADAWQPIRGKLRVIVDNGLGNLAYGDEFEAVLRARRPDPPGNPGEYDALARLRRAGISGTAVLPGADSAHLTGARRGVTGLHAVFALKTKMLAAVGERITWDKAGGEPRPSESAAVVQCLILGEYDNLTPAQMRAFRETGTLHFLAISGQHISLIAFIGWILMGAMGIARRPAAVIVLVMVALYGILAGFEASILRSVIMCGVLGAAFIFVRRPNVPASLSLALILVLLLDPADLYSAGLQLSFVAVLALWLFSRPIEWAIFGVPDPLDRIPALQMERTWVRHPLRYSLQQALCISLAAWLATAPLLAQHFGMVTVTAPVASVLLAPPVWVALMAGLPGVLLAPFAGWLAKPFLWIASGAAWVLSEACKAADRLPGIVAYVPPPGWWMVGLMGGLFVAAIYRDRLRLNKWRIMAAMALLALLYAGLVWRQPAPAHLRVQAISVGRGNCILVRFPDGRNLLFDAGCTGRPDIGARVIAPALRATGVRKLDLVILSHADDDHCNGFAELARQMPVGALAAPTEHCFRGHSGNVIHAGDSISGFEGEVEVLWPPSVLGGAKFTPNELSAVVRVRHREGTVLLTGDFGRRATESLLNSGADLRADILQVPHHGMADSSAPLLAAAVRPQVAIIPGGASAQAAPDYAPWAGRLISTDECGMITVELAGGRVVVTSFLKR